MKHRRSAQRVLSLTLAGVLSTTALATATATPAHASSGDSITEGVTFTTLPLTFVVTSSSASTAPTVTYSNGTQTTGLADAQTDAILSSTVTTTSAGFAPVASSGQTGGYDCVHDRNQQHFYASTPVGTAGSTKKEQWRFQFFPYTQKYARLVSGVYQWWFEICAVGGADGQNGYRTLYNASVMAANSNNTANRIGLQADNNGDGTAAASLTMQASIGPVKISGSLPTSGGGTNYGQYGKPKYATHADAYYQTESFAGWKAGCTYSRNCGSSNMQNQVHHGLFEFKHGDWNRQFPVATQWNIYCANPFGVGCG